MRIAVVFEGDINTRLGVFNAVLNRVQHLRRMAGTEVDVHLLQVYDGAVMRRVRGSDAHHDRPSTVTVDGVCFNMHWFKRQWRDALGHRLLGRQPAALRTWLHGVANGLAGYDLLAGHDRLGGYVAQHAARQHGIPHTITWHGASIYTDPPRDAMLRAVTIDLLHGADLNFFVSHGLQHKALELTTGFRAQVLYNGASAEFRRLTDADREALRRRHGVLGTRVVAFVGRFEKVKNVALLPRIFGAIAGKYSGPTTFWAIGDGSERVRVQRAMRQAGIECTMWGMQQRNEIPQLMNCIDLLVLPSQLEGFGLVAIEALQCGANVVGSDAQGIAEIIGGHNAFALDDTFVDRLASRGAALLQHPEPQPVPEAMSWEATARTELTIYQSLIDNRHRDAVPCQ